jgi:hypothetical protein
MAAHRLRINLGSILVETTLVGLAMYVIDET